MINVASKRCADDGCNKHPNYGEAGSRKREYCAEHSLEGMVLVVRQQKLRPRKRRSNATPPRESVSRAKRSANSRVPTAVASDPGTVKVEVRYACS